MKRGSLWLGSALGLVVGAGLVALPSGAAIAHDALLSSVPGVDQNVSEVTEVSLTFSDTLLDLQGIGNAFAIRVSDEDGRYYGDGCVSLSNETMRMPLELGAAGTYEVEWRAVSTDGHPISDVYSFQYEASPGAATAAGSVEPPTCGRSINPSPEPVAEEAEGGIDAGLVAGLAIAGGLLLAGLVGFAVFAGLRRARQSRA